MNKILEFLFFLSFFFFLSLSLSLSLSLYLSFSLSLSITLLISLSLRHTPSLPLFLSLLSLLSFLPISFCACLLYFYSSPFLLYHFIFNPLSFSPPFPLYISLTSSSSSPLTTLSDLLRVEPEEPSLFL